MGASIEGMVGGCLCGAIRYRLSGEIIRVSQCCCKDCQKATGTGHTTIVSMHKSQLTITAGQPKIYTNQGTTGGDVNRHFCGNCGGRLYTSGDAPGDVIMIQAGSLDDPSFLKPQTVIYTKNAQPWDRFDPDLPKFETRQPPMQPKPAG